jgi:hypothetical protein
MKWSYALSQARNACLVALLVAPIGSAFGQETSSYPAFYSNAASSSSNAIPENRYIRDSLGRFGYIVRLNPSAAQKYSKSFFSDERFQDYQKGEAVNLVKDFERRYGIEVQSMTSWTSLSFAAYLDEKQLAELRDDPRVVDIVPDQRIELSADTTAVWTDSAQTAAAPPNSLWSARVTQSTEVQSWGKRAVNQTTATSNGTSLVYVVDLGVGQHEDLNVVEWVNTNNPSTYHCGSRPGIACTSANLPAMVGCYTHATAVAGIIGAKSNGKGVVGIDPGVRIVSVSFTTPNVNAANACNPQDLVTSKVQAALNWIMADISSHPSTNLSVVNLSQNGTSFAVDLVPDIQKLAKKTDNYPGAFVVESAGNQFLNACQYAYSSTSASDGVMVIGAINNHGQPVVPLNGADGFWKNLIESDGAISHQAGSNYGPCVEAWAPGDAIFTTMGAATKQRSDTVYNTYAYGSGTSFAAPHVAGLAAYLIENFALATPALVEANIRGRFSDLGSRAPTTSSFPPASPNFHDNATGAAINLPTMNPLAAGVTKNTPYAEFVAASKCFYPKFATKPSECKAEDILDSQHGTASIALRPFESINNYTSLGIIAGMAPNNSVLGGNATSRWVSFDSYGTDPYSCDVSTAFPGGSGSVVHSGGKYYYDAAAGFYSPYIYSSACPSANVTVP